jgi:hypothetical protein
MSDDDLGAKPEPETEPPEHFPGGADAIDDSGKYGDTPGGPATRDLGAEGNPEIEDRVPDEIAEPDEKKQEPDDETGENDDQPTEPPA